MGLQAFGASQATAAQNAAISAQNDASINAYNYSIAQQNQEWNNTLKIWNQRLDEYDKQLKRNMDAAYGYGGAYMGLQVRTNEEFRKAAFQSQASLGRLYKTLGVAQATGQTGATAERFDVQSLAAFGREQGIRASNLTKSIEQQKLDQENVKRQLENANNQAYSSVAVAPVPGMRPAPPVLQASQSTNFVPYIGEAVIGGFTGLSKSGFFGDSLQDQFLQ